MHCHPERREGSMHWADKIPGLGQLPGPSSTNGYSLGLFTTPNDFSAPRIRSPIDRANCISTNPSIPRRKVSLYPYHHNFFMPGMRSASTYFVLTISSSPNRPCDRPIPLPFTPPCGASLIPKQEIVSLIITVPAMI